MRPLSAHELLRAWEIGRDESPANRALVLLAAACPDDTWDDLAALPIGRRDARLLTLREWTFGTRLASVVTCPSCVERIELRFTTTDVRVEADPATEDGRLRVRDGDDEAVFRLPDSTDLLGLDDAPDPRRHILSRCVQQVHHRGTTQATERLGSGLCTAIVERMHEADPQACVTTTVACPTCAHSWRVLFDIVAFLWDELESWVTRMLRDVHTLAGAYGWTETDILALSPWRRQQYLHLALS